MKDTAKKIGLLTAGWFLILLGVVGIVAPILPGIPFLIVGFSLLATEYAWARHLLAKLKARFPKFAAAFDAFTVGAPPPSDPSSNRKSPAAMPLSSNSEADAPTPVRVTELVP